MRSKIPREPTDAVEVNIQTADAPASTTTEEGLSRTMETGEDALLFTCNENVSVSVPVLNTRTSNDDSMSGLTSVGPLGP